MQLPLPLRIAMVLVFFGCLACTGKNSNPSEPSLNHSKVTCLPGERAITFVNNCVDTVIYVGAAGNAAGTKICASDSDCPGSSCDLTSSPHTCKALVSCSKNADCPGVNQFCNGATPSEGQPYCQEDSDCDTSRKQYCDKSAGVPGYMGVKTCAECPTNTVCDSSNPTNIRCAFYQCAVNQCYFMPVPLDQPVAANASSCSQASDCADAKQFCYAPMGASGYCVDVPQKGNGWTLQPGGTTAQICVPTPWAGRFWPRTNCAEQGGSYLCDVGSCLGQKGSFSQYCAQSGINSPTVAELFFPTFDGIGNDFYDVSMVDGASIGIQVAPDSSTYDLSNSNGIDSDACPTSPNTCEQKHNSSGWICDPTLNKCVNMFQCASPGCASGCDQYGYGAYQGSARNCKWSSTDNAVAQSDCPAELQSFASKKYVGCKSPKDACASASPNASLKCGTYTDLYGCTGANSASCYSSQSDSCCGCPSWQESSCTGDNKTWETQAKPYYDIFHDACPTAYVFPYDDKNSTFTCIAKTAQVNVNYVLTFCPK